MEAPRRLQPIEWTPPVRKLQSAQDTPVANRVSRTKGVLMSTVIIAVDLAKTVFEIAGANASGTVVERRRMSRTQFERFWIQRPGTRVVMEACASAHFWARRLLALGFEVVLLPPEYVRPYVL